MKKIKLISPLLATLIVASTPAIIGCSVKEVPIHTSVYPKTEKIASKIYTINRNTISDSMYVTLESLEGILAQTEARIFIYCGDNYRDA